MSLQSLLRQLGKGVARSWVWIGANKDTLTIVFAVLAGATALYQYLQSVEDGRKKETLKYVERSQDQRVADSRSAIARSLLDASLRLEFDSAVKAANAVPRDVQPIDRFVVNQHLDGPIIVLVEHYTNLAGCVDAAICDRSIACSFFAQDIRALNNTFRPMFDVVWAQRDGQNYMTLPMKFANSCPK